MIPAAYITAWSHVAPWPTDEQVEQDLVLARLIVEIANHSVLGQELTFQPEELVATKLRALYQGKKGRDLFDLWLALTVLSLDPAEIVSCFDPYRPDRYTARRARETLMNRLADRSFRSDLGPLLREVPEGYDIDAAGALVRDSLLSLI